MKGADKNVQQNKKPAGRFRSQSDNGRKNARYVADGILLFDKQNQNF